MRPEDLDLLHACGRLSLTPDGALAVVPVLRPDLATDSYRGGLWVVPTDGGPARRLTNGPKDDAPAVSPDGRRVAFLRSPAEGTPPQLHVTGIDGGEPLCLTDHPAGAGAPVWSPDGGRVTYAARVPEVGRYGTEDATGEEVDASAEPPRLVTEPAYRRDDLGYTRDRRTHVFVLAVPPADTSAGAEPPTLPIVPVQLTDGDQDDQDPVWSPDGTTIAFVSSRHDTRETDLRSAVHLVRADATGDTKGVAEPVPATAGDLAVATARWLPDDRLVLAAGEVGPTGRDFVGRPGRLWVTEAPVGLDATEPADLRALTTDELDVDAGPGGLVLLGSRVVVRDAHRGSVRLVALDADSATPEPEVVLEGPVVVAAHAASAEGSTLVVVAADPERAGDLAVVADGSLHWLTDLSAALREHGVRPPRELEVASGDGHPVHGWVVLPDPETHGAGPHPVLLTIHGGPFSSYDWALFDEAQVYAGAGYAVLMCNPRGSAGYGLDHGRSIRHAMGGVDAEDVLAFLDGALADDSLPLDADRVGVMGGSYGGYLTATLTTRTDRFAAAVVERGYLDATSFVGSSDIGWFFPGEYHGSPEGGVAQSPMTHVDRVTTPTLVIHSEADWRCPVEQGQRWFAALRLRGVRTELLLFPGEGHELSRSGRPRHRRERFEHLLRWWGEHLPVG